ncbi:hypothetical protein EXIGLDRAFT_635950 [Exidia glandulosa HHB12029]|uniref:NAD(P)-binding protein n=1 Tax=Exidia glandulosa HHB12029 TaxID=1314781 RepID=A0A165R2G2_EXIGL|nr:hypothetical protein EXIGLDRAFT_635950 [Exidia glandulosa HHB12029]
MSHASTSKPRLIIVVTGANSGVGFGICKRLLFQLSRPDIPDADPQPLLVHDDDTGSHAPSPYIGAKELTLVMACRSEQRAAAARTELLTALDRELARRERASDASVSYARAFRAALRIDYAHVDLTSVSSIFSFCDSLSQDYPYLTHLVLNAGMASFIGVNWPLCAYQILAEGYHALYRPRFKLQSPSPLTRDGLGAVWCANVFSSYILATRLRPLLRDAPYSDARVLWMSSIEADRKICPENLMENYQLLNTRVSYEISKYQTCLIAPAMERRERERRVKERVVKPRAEIRHIIVHPGVTSSNIFAVIGWVLLRAMELAFWLARIAGSPHHVLSAWNGAVSTVHIALTNLSNVPFPKTPVMFGSRCDRLGREYVGVEEVDDWERSQNAGELLVDKCEWMYDNFCEKLEQEQERGANGHANGHDNGNGKADEHADVKQVV